MKQLNIIGIRRIWYSISLTLLSFGILSIVLFGFRYGLDFTGGSLLEIHYSIERPSLDTVNSYLGELSLSGVAQPSGDSDFILRLPEIDETKHQEILKKLADEAKKISPDAEVTEDRFESFGPTLGSELKRSSLYAIGAVLIAIVLYLAYAFRKVSHPVAAWKFGIVTVIALAHDVIFVVGLFSLLGYLYGTEINSLFITALLTLVGFSVHDTIVTLDRIRENLFTQREKTFSEVVNISINDTISRSINTSLTTLFALIAIYFFGGETIKDFSLALIAGIIVGTYSSIFIASPLLVTWYQFSRRKAV